MSWGAFKTEMMGADIPPHTSKIKFPQTLGTAYTNCILRHIDSITGGGTAVTASSKTGTLIQGLRQVTEMNMKQHNQINLFDQIAPHIYSYWAGQTIVGPLGVAVVASTGTFSGPPVPQNMSFEILLNMFVGAASVHLTTLIGTFTNAQTGVTTPWTGATMIPLG